MPTPLGRAARLGRAIRAALHDMALERSGALVYFYDADVIVGALTGIVRPTDLADRDWIARGIVRLFWMHGHLPKGRVTLPHLQELTLALRGIVRAGGLAQFLKKNPSLLSEQLGLSSERPAAERLNQLLRDLVASSATDVETEGITHALGISGYATLAAEMSARAMHSQDLFLSQLDLQSDLGEPATFLQGEDKRYAETLAHLDAIRPARQRLNNAADAAALLAIARLWKRDHSIGAEYRFYTQTKAISMFCSTPLGAALMTRPDAPLPEGGCVDAPNAAPRSSMYFLLRASLPSVGFGRVGESDSLEEERSLLSQLASSLEVMTGTARGDPPPMGSTLSDLLDLLGDLLNNRFAQSLLTTKREPFLNSLGELGKTLASAQALQSKVVEFETQIRNDINRGVERTYHHIAVACTYCTVSATLRAVDVPAAPECDLAVGRWVALFPNDAALRQAEASLRSLCFGSPEERAAWAGHTIARLDLMRSSDDVLAVLIPALIIGDYGLAQRLVRKMGVPSGLRDAAASKVLIAWMRCLSGGASSSKLITSWTDCMVAIEAVRSEQKDSEREPLEGWDICLAWLANYITSSMIVRGLDDKCVEECKAVVATGADCLRRVRSGRNGVVNSDPMARAADLMSAANWAWLCRKNDALEDTVRSEKSGHPSGIYVENALAWATFVAGELGDSHTVRVGIPYSMKCRAFEPFQVALRGLIESRLETRSR